MLKTTNLGRNCGLKVSELCLGTMNFGEPGRGHQGDWTISEKDATPIFKTAFENQLFYFDCANNYGQGACEQVVGSILRTLFQRSEYVLATKLAMPMGPGANQGGLSRKHIFESIDASLSRLGMEYVDQLVIHRHPHGVRGKFRVPLEESMEALHDVVKQGKALYLGASSMFAWQFGELQSLAKMHGWTPFVSMQNHYNLIYREEEREMNPYCASHGIALTPWSPLARGILAGSYSNDFDAGKTIRSSGQDRLRTESLYRGEAKFKIVERVTDTAEKYGKKPAQIALAWLMNKPEITSPIVGVSREGQLEDLVEASKIVLDPQDITYLEELYTPLENLLSIGTS